MFSHSFLGGCRFRDWIHILRDNRFRVDASRRWNALLVTTETISTSILSRFEPEPKLTESQHALWSRPLLILGLPRSGTTYLQNLMASNPQLAFPARLDCFNPHSFLIRHRWGLDRLYGLVPRRNRGLDNVKVGWLTPEEDEFALTVLAADGPWLGACFPERHQEYLAQSPLNPRWTGGDRWKQALKTFTQKLTYRYNLPLVLKSPLHMMRIPEILTLFPHARFVTIFRDPIQQTQSTLSVARKKILWPSLQVAHVENTQYLEFNQRILQRYFETRHQIPAENRIEIQYENLVASPAETLRRIHQQLEISGLDSTLSATAKNSELNQYQTNSHPELTPSERESIRELYAPMYEVGLYPDPRIPTAETSLKLKNHP